MENMYQKYISIHALVKRATFMGFVEFVVLPISIHALVKRATIDIPSRCIDPILFQSTPS